MKISVYSAKGSAGKTPIATNIILDKGFSIGTNETFHVFDVFLSDEYFMAIEPHKEFPEIPDDIDIVFDLAGSINEHSKSITSAIKQSDVVLIPIYNEIKSLNAGINTILEVSKLNKNIVVIATKLQKQKKEVFNNWKGSKDFLNIKKMVDENIDFEIKVLPLKFSKVFDTIFEKEKSITQLRESDPLARYTYKEVSEQFDEIYNLIEKKYG